jgi:hypothetical protein
LFFGWTNRLADGKVDKTMSKDSSTSISADWGRSRWIATWSSGLLSKFEGVPITNSIASFFQFSFLFYLILFLFFSNGQIPETSLLTPKKGQNGRIDSTTTTTIKEG